MPLFSKTGSMTSNLKTLESSVKSDTAKNAVEMAIENDEKTAMQVGKVKKNDRLFRIEMAKEGFQEELYGYRFHLFRWG